MNASCKIYKLVFADINCPSIPGFNLFPVLRNPFLLWLRTVLIFVCMAREVTCWNHRDTRAGMESIMNLPNKYIFYHYVKPLPTALLASRRFIFEEKQFKTKLIKRPIRSFHKMKNSISSEVIKIIIQILKKLILFIIGFALRYYDP